MAEPDIDGFAPRTATTFRAWSTLVILFVIYVLAMVDRTILSLVVDPIKHDLGLTDTQVGLLQGLAFSLVFTLSAIPISHLADRGSRNLIVAAAVSFWSVCTIACGFAASFWQIFVARMGVGLGESALGPCAYSLIGDLFPPHLRGRAMGIYNSALKIGPGLSLLLGGMVLAVIASGKLDVIFAGFRPWQVVFIAAGLPGLLLAVLALAIFEPKRRTPSREKLPLAPAMPFIRVNKGALACLFLGTGFSGITGIAMITWVPTYFIRSYGISPAEIGFQLGLIMLVGGLGGTLLGGALCDYWTRRRIANSGIRTALLGALGSLLFGPMAMLVSSTHVALTLLALTVTFTAFIPTSAAVALQGMVPAPLRSRLSALFLMTVTMINSMVGPFSVGFITDHVFGNPNSIGYSLAIVIVIADIAGIILFALALRSRTVQSDVSETSMRRIRNS